MKFIPALIASLAIGQSAFANIPTAGTIRDEACGHLNKSQRLCLATAVGTDHQYFVIRHFLHGATSVPVKSARVGLGYAQLKGVAIGEATAGQAAEETTYVMNLSTDAKGTKATWIVGGKQQGPQIEMEPVAHPR